MAIMRIYCMFQKAVRTIKDAQITDMQERLRTKPVGERNIVIIEDADTMTLRASEQAFEDS